MIKLMKTWKSMRGYKRHAGAIIVIVPVLVRVICDLVGVDYPAWMDGTIEMLVKIGIPIWGIGWADKWTATITEKKK